MDFSASGDEDGVRALFGDLGEVEDCRGKTTGDAGEMLVGVGGLVGFLPSRTGRLGLSFGKRTTTFG